MGKSESLPDLNRASKSVAEVDSGTVLCIDTDVRLCRCSAQSMTPCLLAVVQALG